MLPPSVKTAPLPVVAINELLLAELPLFDPSPFPDVPLFELTANPFPVEAASPVKFWVKKPGFSNFNTERTFISYIE